MDDIEKKELELLRARRDKQLKRQNEYARNNYDRIAFVTKKGTREKIRQHYERKGFSSLADYFLTLAKADGCPIDPQEKGQT